MNKVLLIGRLTEKPKPRLIRDGVYRCEFSISVNRFYREPDWTYSADVVPCVAKRHHAEFLKALDEGDVIQVEGMLVTDPPFHVKVDFIRRTDKVPMNPITCSQDLTYTNEEEPF